MNWASITYMDYVIFGANENFQSANDDNAASGIIATDDDILWRFLSAWITVCFALNEKTQNDICFIQNIIGTHRIPKSFYSFAFVWNSWLIFDCLLNS